MKNAIEFLKSDRKVNDTFREKLEKVGLGIGYGTFSYWDSCEYVQIGRKRIWLVDESYSGNCTTVVNRYQNEVIEEIIETIEKEVKRAEQSDEKVKEFFDKLNELEK